MEQPPATDAPSVDRDIWIACASPLPRRPVIGSSVYSFPHGRLPVVGSQVYYFPRGHAEQCPAPLPAPLSEPHLFPCTVHAVELFVDANTDEPYATITLTPGPHGGHPDKVVPTPVDIQGDPFFYYYPKQLTERDANNGGGFYIPKTCADDIFPSLDFQADPPVQNLRVRDLLGNQWMFRHIYRGTPRRHFLTTGWTKFVNAKLLVAGDTVVFIRRPNGDLLAGVRRAPRYRISPNAGEPSLDSRARVSPKEVMDSVNAAVNGDRFNVTYYPRQDAGEFVVPREEVDPALRGGWLPGWQVRIQVMEAEERGYEWILGLIEAVDSSVWRMLEVEWESPTKINRHVNPWQIQLVAFCRAY